MKRFVRQLLYAAAAVAIIAGLLLALRYDDINRDIGLFLAFFVAALVLLDYTRIKQ
jgi:1,4-dihydroxy-2-naphthoate octaprenyltransferase